MVSAKTAVETQGKGSVLAAKAVETQSKGTSYLLERRPCGLVRPRGDELPFELQGLCEMKTCRYEHVSVPPSVRAESSHQRARALQFESQRAHGHRPDCQRLGRCGRETHVAGAGGEEREAQEEGEKGGRDEMERSEGRCKTRGRGTREKRGRDVKMPKTAVGRGAHEAEVDFPGPDAAFDPSAPPRLHHRGGDLLHLELGRRLIAVLFAPQSEVIRALFFVEGAHCTTIRGDWGHHPGGHSTFTAWGMMHPPSGQTSSQAS